jgi:protein-S-isoprenylcysteine O-methyltransferase Ste14
VSPFQSKDGARRSGSRLAESLAIAGEVLGKASLLAAFGVFATFKALGVKSRLMSWEPGQGIESYIELAAQVAALIFVVLLLSLTLVRFKPKETAEGLESRISALIGTFLSLSLVALPMADLGPVLRVIAICLVLAGWLLSVYVLAWLGRSFSIMAQARRLVTGGPYAIVRHPLYVSEEIAMIGMVLLCLSPLAILIAAVQWIFQLRRMTHEERVLSVSFPEYAGYAQVTPKIIPRQFRRWIRRVPTILRAPDERIVALFMRNRASKAT